MCASIQATQNTEKHLTAGRMGSEKRQVRISCGFLIE